MSFAYRTEAAALTAEDTVIGLMSMSIVKAVLECTDTGSWLRQIRGGPTGSPTSQGPAYIKAATVSPTIPISTRIDRGTHKLAATAPRSEANASPSVKMAESKQLKEASNDRLTSYELPRPPLAGRLTHPGDAEPDEEAQRLARKDLLEGLPVFHGEPRLLGRAEEQVYEIDDGHEVERDGRGDGCADEAEADGFEGPWSPNLYRGYQMPTGSR